MCVQACVCKHVCASMCVQACVCKHVCASMCVLACATCSLDQILDVSLFSVHARVCSSLEVDCGAENGSVFPFSGQINQNERKASTYSCQATLSAHRGKLSMCFSCNNLLCYYTLNSFPYSFSLTGLMLSVLGTLLRCVLSDSNL